MDKIYNLQEVEDRYIELKDSELKIEKDCKELQKHILEKITSFPDRLTDKKQVQSFLGILVFFFHKEEKASNTSLAFFCTPRGRKRNWVALLIIEGTQISYLRDT